MCADKETPNFSDEQQSDDEIHDIAIVRLRFDD